MIDLNSPCRWNLRIWDNDKHEWLCDKNDDALPYYGFDIRGGEVTAIQGMDLVYSSFHRRDFIWEQSTGLKDCNSKEIYEGDIVSIKDDDIPFGIANALSTDKWLVRFNMHRASFTVVKNTRRRNFIRTFQHIKPEDIEVIGNIHENPELLGGE